MAYCRWGEDSPWYIFWKNSGHVTHKHQELLSVWFAQSEDLPSFPYPKIKEFLKTEDLTSIPGFQEKDKGHLLGIFRTWVNEVDQYWKRD